MAKKRKRQQEDRDEHPRAPKPVFSSPFKDLNKLIKARPQTAAPSAKPSRPTATVAAAIDEAAMLREAFNDVRRLNGSSTARIEIQPKITKTIVSEDAEVLAQLSDLVSGQAPFELTETEEYVEGARRDVDPRLVIRLRRGEFSTQGHIDLHGMIQPDAKLALEEFILDSVRKGRRAVLIVHGRGLRSPGGQPVLKHAAAQWLSHGTIGGYVLAFTTARAYDGGTGALWVLLRRERKRGQFDVLQGAKRRD